MAELSYVAHQVRRYDHDRFLTAIFAPAAMRENLLALYAFNIEIAKIGEIVTEPLIGQMRLQWWRDTLDRLYAGSTVAHAVAGPLGAAIAAGRMDRSLFDRLLDAREFDLDRIAPADMPALEAYAEGTGAPLLALALEAMGYAGRNPVDAARLVGTAWALTGLMRAVPFHARQSRLYLPRDRLDAAGVRTSRLFDRKLEPGLADIVRDVGHRALARLDEARPLIRSIPKSSRAPLLLAILARLHLADLRRAGWNPFILEGRPARPLAVLHLALRHGLNRY